MIPPKTKNAVNKMEFRIDSELAQIAMNCGRTGKQLVAFKIGLQQRKTRLVCFNACQSRLIGKTPQDDHSHRAYSSSQVEVARCARTLL